MNKAQGVEDIYLEQHISILNVAKIHLLEFYLEPILSAFGKRIEYIVNQYGRYLPYHVKESEIEDLNTIAQLEFIETIKSWNMEQNDSVWPLARMRIVGAMKDHIRYVTKSDPSRLYDWINDAASMYKAVNDRADFENHIETGVELNRAMKALTQREQQIVIQHTKKDLTFREIGETLEISESQVSRIYKKSLQKMKKVLKPEGD